jgi:hypothetical protein
MKQRIRLKLKDNLTRNYVDYEGDMNMYLIKNMIILSDREIDNNIRTTHLQDKERRSRKLHRKFH